jgi:soluble lytic murein transglycosylase-like protein
MAHDKTNDLLGELEKLDRREDDILDVLVRRGARLEQDLAEAERRSRLVTGGDLQALTGALASLESAIDGVQTRIAKATDGNGAASASTILELAARLREQDTAGDEIRRQLHERLRALGVVEDAAAASKGTRTFRLTDPRMQGADVKAFQRELNRLLETWRAVMRAPVDGVYCRRTRRAARTVAYGLGIDAADWAQGFTPALQCVIREPSRRTPQQLRNARDRREWRLGLRKPRRNDKHRKPVEPEPVPRRATLAVAIDERGGRYGELIVREAKRHRLPVSLVCALVEQESGFRNVFGHDRVVNPIKSPPNGVLEVTKERYEEYLRHRRRGEGAQGVGPAQLTSPHLQDRADELGGCWKPAANIRVGCEYLADRIERFGRARGVQAYNGAAGDAYATSVFALQRKWRRRLDGAGGGPEHERTARTFRVRRPEMKGADVKAFQRDLNDRLDAWGIHSHVDVDGEYGPQTHRAARKVAHGLGAAAAEYRDGITPELRTMIRTPSRRTQQQLGRAREREAWRRKWRKRDERERRKGALRLRAYAEAKRLVGTMESGGNNSGKMVMAIIRANGGAGPEPWCGDFVAWCYRKAGSKSVTRAWAAVRMYLPLTGLKRTRSPLKGDPVRFTFSHIGLFVCWCDARGREVPAARATHIKTIEGNTGRSGAVSDSTTGGDGVYVKIRARGLVQDYIRVMR